MVDKLFYALFRKPFVYVNIIFCVVVILLYAVIEVELLLIVSFLVNAEIVF